jgi:hypothetical protein
MMKMEMKKRIERERETQEWLKQAVSQLEENAAHIARAIALFRRGETLAALARVRDAIVIFNSVKKEAERRISKCFADFVDGHAYAAATLLAYSALREVEQEVNANLQRALLWGIEDGGDGVANAQWAMRYVAAARRAIRLTLRMFFAN